MTIYKKRERRWRGGEESGGAGGGGLRESGSGEMLWCKV